MMVHLLGCRADGVDDREPSREVLGEDAGLQAAKQVCPPVQLLVGDLLSSQFGHEIILAGHDKCAGIGRSRAGAGCLFCRADGGGRVTRPTIHHIDIVRKCAVIMAAPMARHAPITSATSRIFMLSMLTSSPANVVSLVNRVFL